MSDTVLSQAVAGLRYFLAEYSCPGEDSGLLRRRTDIGSYAVESGFTSYLGVQPVTRLVLPLLALSLLVGWRQSERP